MGRLGRANHSITKTVTLTKTTSTGGLNGPSQSQLAKPATITPTTRAIKISAHESTVLFISTSSPFGFERILTLFYQLFNPSGNDYPVVKGQVLGANERVELGIFQNGDDFGLGNFQIFIDTVTKGLAFMTKTSFDRWPVDLVGSVFWQ
jgi:hypothetical protein